jgi:hypothetical protein
MGKAFDIITEAVVEIGHSLKCYAKFAVAYETSDEVRERLVASYKNIVKFWATATKLLDQNCEFFSFFFILQMVLLLTGR